MSFVHLHVHSHFSLLDGTNRIEDLVDAAVRDGQPALALTDHGNLFGAIEFYRAARRAGIRPILGMEAYVARRTRRERSDGASNPTEHLTLLALDGEGYRNLIRLASIAYLEGFFKKPRLDREVLSRHGKGLFALSGCLSAEIPRLLLAGDEAGARSAAGAYAEIFGRDGFGLEVMRNGLAEQDRLNEALVRLAASTGLPLVATNDVHYLRREDREVQDVLLCIHTGQTLADEGRFRLDTDSLYFRTAGEMASLFADLPRAIAATEEIAGRANLEIELGRVRLPAFETGSEETPDQLFDRLCREGFAARYPDPPEGSRERLAAEMGTIAAMGFVPYFLVVWDLVRHARESGIPVGPGRGSAAGSIVSYVLRITDIDPLRYDLLFERFLNAERISLPDIDIDLSDEGRARVLEYVRRRYGEANVSQIVTFSTMASRAVVRDVGRVLGVPIPEVDRIVRHVPAGPGASLREALGASAELKEIRDSDPRYRRLLDIGVRLEGLARHASVHAAGIVLADRPLAEIVPLYRKGEETTTQYSMVDLEEVGLLKMDLLGLRTLSVLEKAVAIARATVRPGLDLERIPLDDPPTYRLLGRGDTLGVFQLESEGMRSLLVRLQPERFEDLIAVLALYRPGPLGAGMVDAFVRRRRGEEEVRVLHPSLAPILEDTRGVIVYQEQVMRIAHVLAGFTLCEADDLRKAIGKKKPEILARAREKFLAGAVRGGVARGAAEAIWEQIEYFGGYGFNRSHSTAYAFLTYRTAYLKANARLAFTCANLTCEGSDTDKVRAFVEDARRAGLKVLPPDLNRSAIEFTVEGESIRYGLGAIKGVGERAAEALVSARALAGSPLADVAEAARHVDAKLVHRAVFETLVRAGAFDFTGLDRGELLDGLDAALGEAARLRSDLAAGQGALFDPLAPSLPRRGSGRRLPESERLAREREALGFYLTGHPLERHRGTLRLLSGTTTASLSRREDGEEAALAGRVDDLRVTTVKQGPRAGERMARFVLEDLEGTCPVVVFAEAYARLRDRIESDALVLAQGRVDRSTDPPGLRLRDIERIEEVLDGGAAEVVLRLGPEQVESLPRLRETLSAHRGERPLRFEVVSSGGGDPRRVRAGDDWRIEVSEGFLAAVEGILGPGAVRLARIR